MLSSSAALVEEIGESWPHLVWWQRGTVGVSSLLVVFWLASALFAVVSWISGFSELAFWEMMWVQALPMLFHTMTSLSVIVLTMRYVRSQRADSEGDLDDTSSSTA